MEIQINRPNRKSIRMPGYDYRNSGFYFMTICSFKNRMTFGKIENNKPILSPLGAVVENEWLRTAILRPYVHLHEYVIMPNHFHALLLILRKEMWQLDLSGTREKGKMPAHSIHSIIAGFKSAVTNSAHKNLIVHANVSVWQKGYFEKVVRNERVLEFIQNYIQGNPAKWQEDRYYIK